MGTTGYQEKAFERRFFLLYLVCGPGPVMYIVTSWSWYPEKRTAVPPGPH